MAKTVVGLIENRDEAQKAVQEMIAAGIDKKDIGVISPEELARETTAAVAGASTGMLVGGLAGMLLAAAAIAIPGVGPVLVAGPALALLGGTAVGAVAGGLIGGLTMRGVPEADAHLYAEGIQRGATLVVVTGRGDELARKAVEILKRHGAIDLEQRSAQWKKLGWSGRSGEAARAPSDMSFTAEADLARMAPAGSSPATATPATASSGSAAPADAARDKAREAKVAASGVEPAPGIATVCVYEFEIVEPALRGAYPGPERRVRSTPHEPDRRLAA
jgi:hypothetical protein